MKTKRCSKKINAFKEEKRFSFPVFRANVFAASTTIIYSKHEKWKSFFCGVRAARKPGRASLVWNMARGWTKREATEYFMYEKSASLSYLFEILPIQTWMRGRRRFSATYTAWILPRTSKICIHGKLGNHLTIQTENFSLILISPFSFKGSVFRLYTWSTYLECECECCLDSWQWCRSRDYRGKSAGQAILPRYI